MEDQHENKEGPQPGDLGPTTYDNTAYCDPQNEKGTPLPNDDSKRKYTGHTDSIINVHTSHVDPQYKSGKSRLNNANSQSGHPGPRNNDNVVNMNSHSTMANPQYTHSETNGSARENHDKPQSVKLIPRPYKSNPETNCQRSIDPGLNAPGDSIPYTRIRYSQIT